MSKRSSSFRIGRVLAYLRGRVWYLCYHEFGQRRRPRVGPDKEAARQLAAQINAQVVSVSSMQSASQPARTRRGGFVSVSAAPEIIASSGGKCNESALFRC